MFVVYEWEMYEGPDNHRYFKNKENAEAYARKLREEEDRWANVEVEEVQTED